MKHIPNLLTVLRIILVPVFLYLILNNRPYSAVTVFIAAGLTDGIDGFLARRFNTRTRFGTVMDPFADKFLLVSAYIALAAKGFIPLWLCVPVILKDSLLLSGLLALKGTGKKVEISPSVFGKATTVLQILTVVYAMLVSGEGAAFTALAVLTAAVTVYTGVDYARREFSIQAGQRPG